MRLIVTRDAGVRYGGRLYQKGEELELPDDKRSKVLATALMARKQAKKYGPVVLGTEPPRPREAAPPAAPPPSAPVAPMTTETWMQPPWAAQEPAPEPKAEPPEEVPPDTPATLVEEPIGHEPEDENSNARRRGRHHRRDIRPEE